MGQMPNGSFEWGWTDIFVEGQLMQQPMQWKVSALPVGSPLRSTGAFPNDDPPVFETVKFIPDVVHMDALHLPPEEHLGGTRALILQGGWTLKVFRDAGPFSYRMETDVPCMEPNLRVVVPIQTHQHGDGSPGAACWRVGVDDNFSRWHTFKQDFQDRTWFTYDHIFPVHGYVAHVVIDLESRAIAGIDFWLDDLKDEHIEDAEPERMYERTYFLLPGKDYMTKSEMDWLLDRLSGQIYEGQYTFGFSADDAGAPTYLNVRHVYVVSLHPTDWDKAALTAFFEENYPGVILHFVDIAPKSSLPVGTDEQPPRNWYVPTSQLFSAAHPGIDINLDVAPWGDVERGMPVKAVLDGVVHYVTDDWSGVGMCVVRHEWDGVPYWIMYAHQDVSGLVVGQNVEAGFVLGHIADWRGGDGGDHLHFGVSTKAITREYLTNDGWIDPVAFLKLFQPPELVDAMVRKGDSISPVPPPPDEPQYDDLRSNNVLGWHMQSQAKYWDRYWSESMTNVLKVFSFGHAVVARQVVPDKRARILWRKFSDDLDITGNPTTLLDRYSQEIKLHASNMGVSETSLIEMMEGMYLESLNEKVGTFTPDRTKLSVDYDVRFAQGVYARYGKMFSFGGGTIPIGNPHESEFGLLVPLAAAAELYNGVLCYHAYWTRNEQRSFETEYWSIHAGRWMAMDTVFRAQGIYPRWLLSEGGIVYANDGLNFDSGRGWRATGPFEGYMLDMDVNVQLIREWNRQHGNRCFGTTLFCYGSGGSWMSFEPNEGDVLEMNTRSVNWR